MIYDQIIIGGGAAGIFASLFSKGTTLVLEKTAVLLSKVKISGGGRCNVTHACFDPQALVKNYPRGEKELLGPFHHFAPQDTIDWFETRGVKLKTEPDGRIFPTSDRSQTIIDCLLSEAQKKSVEIRLRQHVVKVEPGFKVHLKDGSILHCKKLVLATGNSIEGYSHAESLGHTIQPPVPSLFTFNVPTSPLLPLSGISVPKATVKIEGTSFVQTGPLLITHFGFSGPAVLKLSAWGARALHEKNYKVDILIDWAPGLTEEEIHLPKNLAKALADHNLHADRYHVDGKTTHKEEFVTCGGVTLKEVNFKTMESKLCPGLYFAGEVLNIDGITGGFNFQNAWTTGFIAGNNILVF